MARTTALGNASQNLRAAVRTGDLPVLFQSSGTLVSLMFNAIHHARSDDLKVIEKDFANAHAMMLLLYDLDPTIGPAAAAWMLKAKADAAAMARRLVPETPADATAGPLSEKVLRALKAMNVQEVTNIKLARDCKADPAAITRALAQLRIAGFVQSRKLGRNAMSRLTDRGRARAIELASSGQADRSTLEAERTRSGYMIAALARGEAGEQRLAAN